jgi:hypothetical protein
MIPHHIATEETKKKEYAGEDRKVGENSQFYLTSLIHE